MNNIDIMGRLTAEPEITSTTGGTTVAKYSVAVDRKLAKEGQQDVDFFPCVSWGKQAEFVEKYLHKGTKVVISGVMNLDRQLKDGKTTTYPKINVREIEFAESKKDNESKAENKGNDFLNIPDGLVDELPFS